ncbi:malonic semialdehyde reductase [Streptomyces sp. NPDC099088]|uniref:malonic semialdehyde reductase n=1 Tax=Streptomyces sp. NPDC099088 TaxID=3366101 RepID=UPI003828BB22
MPSDVMLALNEAAQDLLFREARTANSFTDEPVTDDTVRAVYELIKYAPTSFNGQPLRVLLVRTEESRARLVQHMSGPNQAKTQAAPLVALLAADLEFHETLPRLMPHFPQAKDLLADPSAREQAALFSGAMQLSYFIMGVRAAGLAAGPMLGFDADAINKEFFGDGGHKVIAVVNVGKPGENAWFPRAPRLAYDEVFTVV